MNKILKFAQPRPLASVGHSINVMFPYSIIDESYLETPEEKSKWEQKYITVKLTDSLGACWEKNHPTPLSDDEIEKVMFEYGVRELSRKAQDGELPEALEYTLFSDKLPQTLEFDPARIEAPKGAVRILEVKRTIGFNK